MTDVMKASDVSKYFDSQNLNQMFELAEKFHKANCFGGNIKNAEQALVMMQAGFEMGIPPVEALNSLYIVNGKITIYGAAMSKRLKLKGWKIKYEDGGLGKSAFCRVVIEKDGEVHEYTATAAELEKLGSKAFGFAPKEKLRWHALSRLIRFEVPEVLDAGISYLQEEMIDLPQIRKTKQKIEIANDNIEEGEIVKEELIPQKTPYLDNLQKELRNLGANDEKSALKILNESLEVKFENFDIDENTASELLIKLLQKPTLTQKNNINEKYNDPKKIKGYLNQLNTIMEINGLIEEINQSYQNGDMTQSIHMILTELCAKRIEEINAKQ